MFGLNPYVILGAAVLYLGTAIGAYFYGHTQGVDAEKAALADQYSAALSGLQKAAKDAAEQGTAAALADFKAKTDVIGKLAAQLSAAQGTMDAAAYRLRTSLKGSTCVLSPAQRLDLECLRRPDGAACHPASPTVH